MEVNDLRVGLAQQWLWEERGFIQPSSVGSREVFRGQTRIAPLCVMITVVRGPSSLGSSRVSRAVWTQRLSALDQAGRLLRC